MRRTLVAGNWKLNGSKQDTKDLIEGILGGISEVKNADVAVCPPFVYIRKPLSYWLLRGLQAISPGALKIAASIMTAPIPEKWQRPC